MSDVSQTIHDLPLGSWIPIILLVICGLALWAAGGRLLRPAFGALGLVVGAAAGGILGTAVNFGLPAWMIAILGGLVLGGTALLAYRLAVAAGLAMVLAIALPLALWSMADPEAVREMAGGGPQDHPTAIAGEVAEPERDELDEWIKDITGQGADEAPDQAAGEDSPGDEGARDPSPLDLARQVDEARNLADQLLEKAQALWESTPVEWRGRLIGAAVVGGVIGLLLGTLAAGLSASLVTSFGGTLMWLTGVWAGASRLGISEEPWLPRGPLMWLVLWVVLAVIGLAIQWTIRPREDDKSA
jgi:hypothetical protein